MRKFFSFKGATNRKAFWLYLLAVIVAIIVIGVIAGISTPFFHNNLHWHMSSISILLGFIWMILGLSLFPIAARRLHDAGYSGWCMFIPFYRIYLWCLPGVENKGADPKNNTAKTIGIILLVLSALGIPVCGGLTAAVAIPSYHKYIEESKAAAQRSEERKKATLEIYQKEMAALNAAADAVSDGATDATNDN